MRIISQTKDLSIDFDHTPICVSYNHVCAIIDGQQKVIGQYKTDTRAQEVFEDIHMAYSGEPVKVTEPDDDSYDKLLKYIVDGTPITTITKDSSVQYINNGIYIMPAE